MTNYIEVEHYYKDQDGTENWDIHYAVKPKDSRYKFNDSNSDAVSSWNPGWALEGGDGIRVTTREDVAGVRKLLDAVEAQIREDAK